MHRKTHSWETTYEPTQLGIIAASRIPHPASSERIIPDSLNPRLTEIPRKENHTHEQRNDPLEIIDQ